jgi:hypothetical protein
MRCFCKRIRTYHVKVVLLDEQELIQEIQVSYPDFSWPPFSHNFQ